MTKCTKAALSGEKMLELYKNNKIDENFNNPQSLQNLLEYQTELIASGKSADIEVLTMCSDRLFKMQKYKAPDKRRLLHRITMVAAAIFGVVAVSLATAGVSKALGIDFFENIFMRDGETTLLYADINSANAVFISQDETYELHNHDGGSTEEETAKPDTSPGEELVESYKPGWLPDGYELEETSEDGDENINIFRFYYKSGNDTIRIFVTEYETDYMHKSNNDGLYYEEYEYAGIKHVISSNNNYMHVYWKKKNTVFEITASSIDVNSLKRIVNSYYQEAE